MSASPPHSDVIVVDERDRQIGVCDKLVAHTAPGKRHRAFSVFLFTPRGQLLLQRRADSKYHFAGKWSNSCDGHPGPDDDLIISATRRVLVELGVYVALRHVGVFAYRAIDAASGLVEDEVDHVLVGEIAADLRLNPAEVAEVHYWRLDDLASHMAVAAGEFVPWLSPGLAVLEASGVGLLSASAR